MKLLQVKYCCNDTVNAAVAKIKAILAAERFKVNRNENLFENLLGDVI